MGLRWYEDATATIRTLIAEVCERVEYHLVIGKTLATLVRVGEQNTALACGDPDELRARAEELAANERPPTTNEVRGQVHIFEPPAPAAGPALSTADMINDLPKLDQIATAVDEVIKT